MSAHTTASPTWSHEPARVELEQTKAALQAWLRERRPVQSDLAVVALSQPTANGGTGDILIATVSSGPSTEKMVVRFAPVDLSSVYDVDIAQHFRLLESLEPTAVPSPPPLWLETDPRVLGVPFMVMGFVAGRAPSDFPIYNESGFLVDATPAYRRELWNQAMDGLAAVHTLDPAPFAYLDRPDRGPDGLRQHIAYLRESLGEVSGDRPVERIERVLDWVEATAPRDPQQGLAWGDPRIGNMLFDDAARVRALLDWDQASLAGPIADLGWWLLFDRLHDEDYGSPRLPGLGTRQETVDRWERSTGRSAEGLPWYEILAALRLSIVRLRGWRARELRGLWVPDADNPRSWQRLMARVENMIAAHEA